MKKQFINEAQRLQKLAGIKEALSKDDFLDNLVQLALDKNVLPRGRSNSDMPEILQNVWSEFMDIEKVDYNKALEVLKKYLNQNKSK